MIESEPDMIGKSANNNLNNWIEIILQFLYVLLFQCVIIILLFKKGDNCMPFPKTKRVKYGNKPLENVICQLRFPPILKIDAETPYKFQNEIRKEFPNYNEKVEMQQEINIGIQNKIVNPMTKVSSNKNYEFISEDGKWKINLTRTFLSISTTDYSTWEQLLEKLKTPLKAFEDEYQPAFYSRIGLRYVDVFCRSKVGLEGCAWSELIATPFLGLMGSEVAEYVNDMNNVYEIRCDDNQSMIRINTKLVKKIPTNEQCFMMDSDVFTTGKVTIENAVEKLNYLHDRSSRLVRFAITDKMHERMEPEELCSMN